MGVQGFSKGFRVLRVCGFRGFGVYAGSHCRRSGRDEVLGAWGLGVKRFTVNPIKLETGLRPNSAGIPYTLLLGIEAMEFPTFWLLLYIGAYEDLGCWGLLGILGLL